MVTVLQSTWRESLTILKLYPNEKLTLILLEPKMISLATSKEPGQSAHPCSLIKLYTVG